MGEVAGAWAEAAHWYPDVVAAGGLSQAWQAELDRLRTPSWVRPRIVDNPRSATVERGDRRADLLLSPRRRQFYLALRAGQPTALQGFAPDLTTTAGAARQWVSGERPGQVAAAWPWLGSVALAEARERGDRRAARWLWLHENHCADQVATRLGGFVALAFHEPRLRALYPYTSHWNLSFSTTSQWPFTRDHPVVAPGADAGRYVVGTRDGRVHDETDAAGALRLVLAEWD
ncbi:hypothetical protein SAMN05421812_114237 [Asanoa hainanensis]|uniref:Uncharacterized protein n=1 Tax=Asanoa hainanensis TaxID=560556 RepID=A0A239P7M0_9ACTN|nr:DUF6193 family natural product biosynthesis protein [Asanoa hainanensis]SNT62962.1 hypothetical protein SAMN05421812_114237 [Asanoa hainanensis]